MGQIFAPSGGGIAVAPIDRESGPGAAPGAVGNRSLFLGLNAGQNAAVSDLIVLGNSAGGSLTRAALGGTIIIGSQSFPAVSANANGAPVTGAITALGFNQFPIGVGSLGNFNANVFLGDNIGKGWVSGAQDYGRNVIAGSLAMQSTGATPYGQSSISNNVIIGYKAGADPSNTTLPVQDSVIIGATALAGVNGAQQVTLIGATATIAIGFGLRSTCIGYATAVSTGDNDQIVIGNSIASISAVPQCAIIGTATGHCFLGSSQTGSVNFGNTSAAVYGTSTVGIINGVKGIQPTGGGYFYVSGGFLRWVDSANVETAISLSAAGQLANTTTAYTNSAAAAAATLTNAPVAGNPTKWIPINDNGTIRNIPAW